MRIVRILPGLVFSIIAHIYRVSTVLHHGILRPVLGKGNSGLLITLSTTRPAEYRKILRCCYTEFRALNSTILLMQIVCYS